MNTVKAKTKPQVYYWNDLEFKSSNHLNSRVKNDYFSDSEMHTLWFKSSLFDLGCIHQSEFASNTDNPTSAGIWWWTSELNYRKYQRVDQQLIMIFPGISFFRVPIYFTDCLVIDCLYKTGLNRLKWLKYLGKPRLKLWLNNQCENVKMTRFLVPRKVTFI